MGGNKSVKQEDRIGTKPEDFSEFLNYSGSRILVTSPEEVNDVPIGQKVIIKTNINSLENPMLPLSTKEISEGNEKTLCYNPLPGNSTLSYPVIARADMSCAGAPPVPSVHQTMEEMDFERGLWYPALTGDLPRVRNLLQKGNNPNQEDKNGYTALHYAARCGFTTICTILLEAGASVNKATRAGGSTPLHRAALTGNDDTITVLIKYGANLLSKDTDGRVPLHRAVEANHPTTVALLLEASPESALIKDNSGKTARSYIDPTNSTLLKLFEIVDEHVSKSDNRGKIMKKNSSKVNRDLSPFNAKQSDK